MPQDFLIFEKPKKYSHHNQRFTKKGNNKQYLMREVAEPTKEAKVNAETILFDQDCVTIYVDASELNYQGIFGLGVCMVGFGETFVVKKKVYDVTMRKQNVYAEFLAIHFALDNIGEFFKRQFNLPKEIAIFSDLSLVSKLNANKRVTRNKVINIIVEQINEKMEQFHDHFPQVRLQINAMDKEQKRYNPYYKAAHNAARKAIKPLS